MGVMYNVWCQKLSTGVGECFFESTEGTSLAKSFPPAATGGKEGLASFPSFLPHLSTCYQVDVRYVEGTWHLYSWDEPQTLALSARILRVMLIIGGKEPPATCRQNKVGGLL